MIENLHAQHVKAQVFLIGRQSGSQAVAAPTSDGLGLVVEVLAKANREPSRSWVGSEGCSADVPAPISPAGDVVAQQGRAVAEGLPASTWF